MESKSSSKRMMIRDNKRRKRRSNARVSFSAKLPDDVCGIFADSICAVKYSTNPFLEIRESIIEMIKNIGIQDWKEMEELIYCYIFLNSSDLHNVIQDAFLSIFLDSSKNSPIMN
ncbi:hypothetical protein M9H77_26276 [Catharanthus roseus]|uniref:Uncharacterized protein n=1 Tax=Catharanthus roseus TaxID=4058 RepID=A0ACC0ABW6_CATRO|nr:hypothetical protein M9H77_26276 [Catharanthus roseus]